MRRPCVRLTLKHLFVVIAIISAYLGGIVSNRALLDHAWKDLELAQKTLACERQQREWDRLTYEFLSIASDDNVSSDRLADHVNRFNAHLRELDFPPPSAERFGELVEFEQNLRRELSTGNPNPQNPAERKSQ